MNKDILFVDNDERFLNTHARLLEKEKYRVSKVQKIEEASNLLKQKYFHLIILDIRMEVEDDPNDISGLIFAQNEEYRNIPKIILTAYPSYVYVRDVLGPTINGLPPAVNFLNKDEGPQALLNAVEEAFDQYVRVNWELIVVWPRSGPISFDHLASLIYSQQRKHSVKDIAWEIENLIRILFHGYDQINISRLLWHKDLRVSIEVLAFKRQKKISYIVTFGLQEKVIAEQRAYEEFLPLNEGFPITDKSITAETLHFAATAWLISGGDTEDTIPFINFFLQKSERQVNAVIKGLFFSTLGVWYHQNRQIVRDKSLVELLRESTGLPHQKIISEMFRNILHSLEREAIVLDRLNIVITQDKIQFKLGDDRSISYPDPITYLFNKDILPPCDVLCVSTPETDNLDTILVDSLEQCWLTDFAHIHLSPIWQDFVSLEIGIRFNLLGNYELISLIDFEEQLLKVTRLDEKIRLGNVIPDLRKGLSAILATRQMAAKIAGDDLLSYYVALLFYSAKAFTNFDPGVHYTNREIVSLTHRLIFMALLSKGISELLTNPVKKKELKEKPELTFNEQTGKVSVGHLPVDLTQTEFALLRYLFDHADQLCKREDILKDVFDYESASPKAAASLINTTIARVRSKIESGPGNPQFIQTIRGKGYILKPKPE